jgi:hypothetical protein
MGERLKAAWDAASASLVAIVERSAQLEEGIFSDARDGAAKHCTQRATR